VADPFLLNAISVNIPSGATGLSAEVDIGGATLVGIIFPSNWTAAGLSFQHSLDGSNGGNVWGELNYISSGALAAQAIPSVANGAQLTVMLDPTQWRGIRLLKLRSGTAGSPVNQSQSGGANLILLTRVIF
jgi:hypothetical protein